MPFLWMIFLQCLPSYIKMRLVGRMVVAQARLEAQVKIQI